MENKNLNTFAIQKFIKQVQSAENSRAKDVTLDIASAKNLAFTLGIVMARLHEELETLIKKQENTEEQIEVRLDGGNTW